jgi:uncharacterized RDD family membrane protein YckC
MSQWFGNPDRKPGKAPGGGTGGSSNARSRPQSNRPFRDPPSNPDRFVSPASADDDDDEWLDAVPDEPPRAPRKPAPGRPIASRPGGSNQQRPVQRPQPNANQYPLGQGQNPAGSGQRGETSQADGQEPQEGDPNQVPITRVEIGRRAVALIIDLLACYIGSVAVMLVPLIGGFVNITLILTLFFLVRDFLFEGRGIGKNFMGLQVVDRASGLPPTLLQSVQRNIVLIAPCLVTQIVALALRLVPIPFVDHFIKEIVNIVGMIYVVIVLPLESYRAYSRADGLRIGDEIAGTEIVESTMDFSKPVPRA